MKREPKILSETYDWYLEKNKIVRKNIRLVIMHGKYRIFIENKTFDQFFRDVIDFKAEIANNLDEAKEIYKQAGGVLKSYETLD